MACFLNIGHNRTRGHSWALAKERCKLDIRKYAFSQRTINEWNRLPGAGFMNRRRLCQLTAAILTSDLTTHMWVL